MGRPPKKSCNACCSVSETPTPDPPGTPDPNPDPNYRSPTSCDDMINIVLLGSTMVSRSQWGRGWSQSRSQEEIDNEYTLYRAAYPNRIHIVLEVFPSYLPAYISKATPRILYPADYHDDTFDFSYFRRFGYYADKDQSGQARWWSRINQMINASSTEAQNLFNNSSQVCVDIISDRHLEEQFRQSSTILGFKYNTLLNDILEAGKDLVLPVGRRGLTNTKLRTKAFFSGFAHHQCCNSASADSFRKTLTATPDCFPTMGEEPDSEYKLNISNDDIFPDVHPLLFNNTESKRPISPYGYGKSSVTLNSTLLKGDALVLDRAVSYILQKSDQAADVRGGWYNNLGDTRKDASRNEIDSFSDLFPLAVDYPNQSLVKRLDVESTHHHNRIPLKYAKTLNVYENTNDELPRYSNKGIIGLDLISIAHPGDIGSKNFGQTNYKYFKTYPETGDAKLFRKAHAPDWFSDYKIPVDFMAVEEHTQVKVYVKRPVTDFETLTDFEFLYGGTGSPKRADLDPNDFIANNEEKLGFKYTNGTVDGTYQPSRRTRNLAHFLLRTANEKDTDDISAREYWNQNEWVQIGDTITQSSPGRNEVTPKLACRQSYNMQQIIKKKRTDLFLATGTKTGANIRKYNTDTESWDSYASIDLSAVVASLGIEDRPTNPSRDRSGTISGRVLDFKVKHSLTATARNTVNQHDAYLVLRLGSFDPQIFVFKESFSSGNFELLFYTVGEDASMDAGCSKLLVAQCNNSKTEGTSSQSSRYEPARNSDATIRPMREIGGNVVQNDWYNATLFSIPESPASNAFVEPDVVFSEANGYLTELASCETVNMEAAGHAFVFTPSRLFRDMENGKVTKDLIMGMCQYIHPAVNYAGGVTNRRKNMSSRTGDLSIRQTRVTAAAQFKTGWSCRKADLFYARDIPSRGIRHNFLNSPLNWFTGPLGHHGAVTPHWAKPQIVLSHPHGFEDDTHGSTIGNVNEYSALPLLNNNIDYHDPPGYEIAIPFSDYPNILFISEEDPASMLRPESIVMDEYFSAPKQSSNDTGRNQSLSTTKSYITHNPEEFIRLSRPGKVFLFKYTNYHGWSYRKMIPDRNGTFRYNNGLDEQHGVESETNTGHNVTGKPGLDSDTDKVIASSLNGGAFLQADSKFGTEGEHGQYGDVGDLGMFCKFVHTVDALANPRNIDEQYYVRDYKTMVFFDISSNCPNAPASFGIKQHRCDIHTFIVKDSKASVLYNANAAYRHSDHQIFYIPYYQQPRLDVGRSPAEVGVLNQTVSLWFSSLFQSPLITTAAGESMGVPNALFQYLDTPYQHILKWVVPSLNKPYGGLPPKDFLPFGFNAYDTLYLRGRIQFPLIRSQRVSLEGLNLYHLRNRVFRIKAVHVRDDGTEDVSFSDTFTFKDVREFRS